MIGERPLRLGPRRKFGRPDTQPTPTPKRHTSPAPERPGILIQQARLRGLGPWIDRGFTLALFGITALGNVGAFGADMDRLFQRSYWRTPELWKAVAWGVGAQVFLQLAQWAAAHRKENWRYWLPLALSVIPSIITYTPLAVPWLVTHERFGTGLFFWTVQALAFAVLVLALIMVDVAQEILIISKSDEG